MLSDTDDDIRSLLLEATSDLPPLAPAHDRTVRRAHRRNIGTVSVVAVLIGLVVGASVSVVDRFDRTVPAKTPQRASGAWIVNITTGTWTRMGGLPRHAFWFSASADGTEIAVSGAVKHRSQIFVLRSDGTDLRQVTHDPYGASQPALSPDGRSLAYQGFGDSSTRNVFVMDLPAGVPHQVTHERHDVSELSWSPDGRRVLYSMSILGPRDQKIFDDGASSVLKVVTVGTGRVEHVAGTHGWPADFGTWSPDGTRIAFMTGHEWTDNAYGFDPAEIWIMDADGTNRRKVLTLSARAAGLTWSPSGSLTFSKLDGDAYSTSIVDVATGQTTRVATGFLPVWLSADTLIVQI